MKNLFEEDTEEINEEYKVKTFEERELISCNKSIKISIFLLVLLVGFLIVAYVFNDFYLRLHISGEEEIDVTMKNFESEYETTAKGKSVLKHYSVFVDEEGREYKLHCTYKDEVGRSIQIYRVGKDSYVRKDWELNKFSYTDIMPLSIFSILLIVDIGVIVGHIMKKRTLKEKIKTMQE